MEKIIRIALFIISFDAIPCLGQAVGGGDAGLALVTSLFSNYSTIVRPNKDYSKPMNVDLDMILVGINGLDEVEGKLTTTGYLSVGWTDEYLTWKDAGVMQLYIPQDRIWKPDLTLKNGFTKLTTLGSDFILAKIEATGFVWWQPFEVFESKCSIDITHFPFDQQTCDLVFVVWSYFIDDVNVTKGTNGIEIENMEESAQWSIVSTSAKEDKEGSESKVTFTLTLQRSSGYYIFNIIIPVIFLGLLNVFTYVLPADSGEKMGYAMTVFLSFSVFLTIVSSELPKSSGSYFGYYLMALLGFGVITVCVTAFELRMHHWQSRVPNWVKTIIRCACCCCCCEDNRVDDVENKKKVRKVTWPDVTAFVDFVMFWILFISFIALTGVVMVILKLRIKMSF
ncbi:acetylcholine receptor subunit alpha-like [Mytilus trossulus]|uniref:acetylcholine receptor subunit alpha-like n=1 Tax=Mytilus trossulus TaxID=6551 RepID=UPI00300616CC